MKKTIGVLVAIAALVMLVVMVADRGTADVVDTAPASEDATATGTATAAAPSATSETGPDLDQVLARLANKANSTLPMMVDRNTRWDTTMGGPGKNFTYFYTIPGHASTGLDWAETREAIAPKVTGSVCGNKDMQVMFKAGVTAHYVYRGNDGVEVVRLAISPRDCGVFPDPWFKPEALLGPA